MTILTVVVAVAVLAMVAAFQLISPKTTEPATPVPASVEDWPAVAATFTAYPTATPRGTLPPTPTSSPTPTSTPLPPPIWSELGYLTSVVYTGTAVVEVNREREGLGIVLGDDWVLLMAVGRVFVGTDLSEVEDSDVKIDGTSLRATLPHARILSVEILPEESRVFESNQSWLFSQYEGIEVEALKEARIELVRWVEDNPSMLELAEKVATLQLSQFLNKAGFEQVDITYR